MGFPPEGGEKDMPFESPHLVSPGCHQQESYQCGLNSPATEYTSFSGQHSRWIVLCLKVTPPLLKGSVRWQTAICRAGFSTDPVACLFNLSVPVPGKVLLFEPRVNKFRVQKVTIYSWQRQQLMEYLQAELWYPSLPLASKNSNWKKKMDPLGKSFTSYRSQSFRLQWVVFSRGSKRAQQKVKMRLCEHILEECISTSPCF